MEPQQHSERMQEVLNKLGKDTVEYFDAGFVVVTFKEGAVTRNAFFKFGNDYAIEGLVGNIHDILFGQESKDVEVWEDDEDDDDDGGQKILNEKDS